jgi:alanyl-tRNA synthetase
LPKPSIDTGAGLERILALVQGVDSVWETDVLYPLIEQAQFTTGAMYRSGDYNDRDSFSLRVLAEHARSATMLINDGVFPSNENRGYVLRRIIRRAVRHAFLLGTEKLVMPSLSNVAIDVMGTAYPDVVKNRDFIVGVLTKEEERFRNTLKTGLSILEDDFAADAKKLSGRSAFLLHDTYGFPLELTQEIAGERGVEVDIEGF